MATFKIGDEEFVELGPESPQLPHEASSAHQRAGIDGVSIRLEGIKSRPFRYRSMVDVTDRPAALETVERHRLLAGTTQNIVWASVDFLVTFRVQYQIIEVQSRFRLFGASVGGLSGNVINPYLVRGEWLLMPVHTPEDE